LKLSIIYEGKRKGKSERKGMISKIELLLNFIQHNKWIYIIAVSIVSGFIATGLYYLQEVVDEKNLKGTNPLQIPHRSVKCKSRHFLITFIICFATGFIPLVISIIYPYIDKPNTITNADGYLKLSFFNGSFAYRNFEGQEHYNDNDIVNPTYYAFFSEAISPLTYITITDQAGGVVYDGKSEHVSECLIGLNYGEYIIDASCDNFKKYTAEVSLTPENKKTNTWKHNIYFIPDTVLVKDIKIQLVNSEGIPYSYIDASIGYQGYTLSEKVDENGFFSNKFTLSKGEYLVSLDNQDLYAIFIIN
jgi:hypothetical protein